MVKEEKTQGIGGWLILFQIGLWYYLLASLFLLILINNPYLKIEGLFGLIIFIPTIILFYKKNKNIKWYAIASLWSPFIFSMFLLIQKYNFNLTFSSVRVIVQSLLWATIWTIYFVKSNRVKNTFVN